MMLLKRGRPNNTERNNLQKNLYWHYTHDISAETAAMELKIDRKIAYKYYKKFSDDIHTISQSNFFEEIKIKIKQRLKSYDYIILELNSMLNSINEKINENDYAPSLMNQKLAVIREIKQTMNNKSDLELKIPPENTLQEAIDGVISKHENT
jgi:hypothetical protein